MLHSASWQPGQPLPRYADKATTAAIITHNFFPIRPRTLERWPLVARRPNKTVVYDVKEAMALAQRKLDHAHAYKQEREQ